jgi:hypothetical protein
MIVQLVYEVSPVSTSSPEESLSGRPPDSTDSPEAGDSCCREVRRRNLFHLGKGSLDLSHIFLLILFAYLCLILPYWHAQPMKIESLDGGYRSVLNLYAFSELEYGRDLVTTTGPLGFLRYRDYWPGTHGYRLALDLLLALVFVVGIKRTFPNRKPLFMLLGVLAFLFFVAVVKNLAWRLLPLVSVLLVVAKLAEERPEPPSLRERYGLTLWQLLFAVTLSVTSWILFTELLASVFCIAIVAAMHYLRFRALPVFALVFLGSLGVIWFASGHTIGGFFDYVSSSLQVSSGYVDVMTLPANLKVLGFVVGCFLLILTTVVVGARKGEFLITLLAALALSGVFFLIFKSGFLRYHLSRVNSIAAVLGVLALCHLGFMVRDRRKLLRVVTSLVALVVCLVLSVGLQRTKDGPGIRKFIWYAVHQPGWQKKWITHSIKDPALMKKKHEKKIKSVREAFPMTVPPGPTDWFGNSQGVLIAHGFEYRPRPVFQSFVTYTPKLAKMNGDFYAGANAPQNVIVDLRKAVGDYPSGLLDARAFLELFQRYRPIAIFDGFKHKPSSVLVLQRRPREPFRLEQVFACNAELGEEISIAEYSEKTALWAEIDPEETLIAKLGRTVYKLPQMHIGLSMVGDLESKSYKFAAAPARGGFLLSPQIGSVEEMERLMRAGFESARPDRVVCKLKVTANTKHTSLLWKGVSIKLYAVSRM